MRCRSLTAAGVLAPCLLMLVSCTLPRQYAEPPERPDALDPDNGSLVARGVPTRFSWQAAARAQRYEFHVFDRASGDIERHYLRDLSGGDVCRIVGASPVPVCSVELRVLLPVMDDHAWRVRAGNSAGWSAWTRTLFDLVAP